MASAGTMDFFEHQDVARRKTSVLILYYVLAVVLIAAAVYFAFAATFIGFKAKTGSEFDPEQLWNLELFTWVIGGTLLVVVTGSLYKISQLSGGGESVAQMLGGRPISPNTRDGDERKVLNVVEEMAIASGTPVPPVFMLDGEDGINAFAAGFSPSDAVIGVTRGCVRQLSRDELQGVIAHEFSHILNGDMRLNIRLIGVLNGILVIGLVGYWVFRTSLYSRSSRSNEKGNKLPIVLLGLIVMIIGYVGVFFGKLIKSAVSRQREYLADASAVQFTRNPAGISGALKTIAGFKTGSRLQSTKAEEASHMFFSNGLTSSLMSLMATHPPLDDRIRRLDPYFDMELGEAKGGGAATVAAGGAAGFAGGAPRQFAAVPDEVVSSVGNPMPEHLSYASDLLGALPNELRAAAYEPFGARAVMYALLLNEDTEARKTQLRHLEEHADPAVYNETIRLAAAMEGLDPRCYLPLTDLAIGTLKKLSASQYGAFCQNIDHLVKADKQIDLFEFTLQRMIVRHLDPTFRRVKPPTVRRSDLASVSGECGALLSCLAHWGADDGEAQAAFSKGAGALNIEGLSMDPADSCGLAAVDEALSSLAAAAPGVKKLILKGCVACVASDGKVTIEEAELLRAVADSLDCPIPPFLT